MIYSGGKAFQNQVMLWLEGLPEPYLPTLVACRTVQQSGSLGGQAMGYFCTLGATVASLTGQICSLAVRSDDHWAAGV